MIIRSLSGVRGLVKTHLTPQYSIYYARALSEMFPEGVIMAGRDSRPSGQMIINEMINNCFSLKFCWLSKYNLGFFKFFIIYK